MLRNAIEMLAENYDTPIENLEKYKNIIEQNLNDPNLFPIIEEQFRPTIIKIGTAGAYLWGCNQNYYGNVSKSCSALCNNGLQYNNNYDNTCQYQIWTYDKELTSKGEISTSKAYIYVPINWNGFKLKDIEKLKNSNVLYATVLTTENSQHKRIIPITSIDNLPIIKDYIEDVNHEKSSNYYYYFIFLIIIIFLFTKLYKF